MSKYCPIIEERVLYLTCQEYSDKSRCRNYSAAGNNSQFKLITYYNNGVRKKNFFINSYDELRSEYANLLKIETIRPTAWQFIENQWNRLAGF